LNKRIEESNQYKIDEAEIGAGSGLEIYSFPSGEILKATEL
jgi:hypothetical protein